jgi:CrcB protein
MNVWIEIAWVALGGAAGAVCRFAVTRALPVVFGIHLGTLTVNVLGCLLFGLLVGWWGERTAIPEALRVGAFVGFLGSFTTFSTYGADTVQLGQAGSTSTALTNIALHNGLGLVAVWVGLRLAGLLTDLSTRG